MFKKEDKSNMIYPSVQADPLFHKRVFNKDYSSEKRYGVKLQNDESPTSKLGWKERDTREIEISQLRKRLQDTERAMARIIAQMGSVPIKGGADRAQITGLEEISSDETNSNECNQSEIKNNEKALNISEQTKKVVDAKATEITELLNGHITKIEEKILKYDPQEENTTIKVIGMEITESCEGGKPWSRPSSPIAPPLHLETITSEPPPSIILENKIPAESQLLISDSLTNNEIIEDEYDDDTNEPTIMLSGKITLSVIPSEIREKFIEEQKKSEDTGKHEQTKNENEIEDKFSDEKHETPADNC